MNVLKISPTVSEMIMIDPSLEAFHEVVEGNIDIVTLVPGKLVMVVNDEGLLLELPLNPGASAIADRPIVGNVFIAGVAEEDLTDVPNGVVPALLSVANLAIIAYELTEDGDEE